MSLLLLLNPKQFFRGDFHDGDVEHRGGAHKRKRKKLEFNLAEKMNPQPIKAAATVIEVFPQIRIEPKESNDTEDEIILWLFDL